MADARVNLFIVGASKCGTTYLHSLLDMHPEICMSSVKEPRIFQRPDFQKSLSQYQGYFEHHCDEPYLGEASPVYSETTTYPEVASRIYDYNPGAKIIYLVRDPFERLRSVWVQAQSTGHAIEEKGYGARMPYKFIDAVYNYPPFLEACRYWTHIEAYRRFFDDDSVTVLLFEELTTHPEAVMRRLCERLGVNAYNGFEYGAGTVNAGKDKLAFNPWPTRLRAIIPDLLVSAVPMSARRLVEGRVGRATQPKMRQAALSPSESDEIRRILYPEVEGVYKYLGRSDDPWKFNSTAAG